MYRIKAAEKDSQLHDISEVLSPTPSKGETREMTTYIEEAKKELRELLADAVMKQNLTPERLEQFLAEKVREGVNGYDRRIYPLLDLSGDDKIVQRKIALKEYGVVVGKDTVR